MKRKTYFVFFLPLIFFIFDRLIKNLYFFQGKAPLLNFRENPNFFYFFQGDFFYWLVGLILFGLVFLIIKSYQQEEYAKIFPLTLIFVAGFSNFLDRLRYGFVIDYLNFFNLWTFNLADLMIFVGSLIFLIKLLAKK